jgi:hypothetical protein
MGTLIATASDTGGAFTSAFVAHDTMTPDMLVDTIHPNTAGQTYIGQQVIAAGN